MANNNGQATFDAAFKSQEFFDKNKKILLGVIIAVLVIVAGYFCYSTFIGGPREEKASTALARGQEYFNAEQFDKALNGDGAGYSGFVKIADDYSSTDAGNLAKLYAGLSYAYLGKWNDAVKYLEDYSPKGDAMVSPAAIEALGNAYAHVGQIDKAVSKLQEAADKADDKAEDGTNNSLSPIFRLQAGELLESQGKKADALKVYQDIKKKYVNSQSDYDTASVPDASNMCFGIVVAEWNKDITGALLDGCVSTLEKHGALPENIHVKTVPGSFELVYGAQQLCKNDGFDAIIILGSVIRGDTPHFDYICQGVTFGISRLNATQNIPVIFGLLTTDDHQQAVDRSGGKLGNKGDECAVDAIKMAKF